MTPRLLYEQRSWVSGPRNRCGHVNGAVVALKLSSSPLTQRVFSAEVGSVDVLVVRFEEAVGRHRAKEERY